MFKVPVKDISQSNNGKKKKTGRESIESSLDRLQAQPGYEWIQDIPQRTDVTYEAVDEIRQTWKYESFGLTPAASALLGLAVSIATGGTAGAIARSVTTCLTPSTSFLVANIAGKAIGAGFSAVVSSATVSLANNKGNVLKTIENMASSQNIRGIVMAMAAAGATYGVADLCGVKMTPAAVSSPSLLDVARDRMGAHALQVGVSTGLQVATGQMDLKEALPQVAINVVANTLGELGANKLCKLYDSGRGSLGYVGHKVGHVLVEGGMGALINHKDAVQGFLSGGGAALAAEVMAESVLPSSMSQQAHSDIIKLTAGTGAFLLGGDVNVAAMAASNAVENNAFSNEAVTKEGLQRQQEELQAYRETGELAITEIPAMVEFLDDLAAPQVAFDQELHQGMRQSDLSWLERISLFMLDEERSLLRTGAALVPTTPLEVGLIAVPVARSGVRAATQGVKGILRGIEALGAEAIAPLGKFEVKPNVMFGENAAPGAVDSVAVWELKHNKKAIKNMTDMELAQSLANRAERKFGEGKGPRIGQQKHKYAERTIKRYQGMTGERPEIVAERMFKGGEVWREGMGVKDHVKPDLCNERSKQAFDYKFGNAKVTPQQTARYQKQLPRKDADSPSDLHEIKPNINLTQKDKK